MVKSNYLCKHFLAPSSNTYDKRHCLLYVTVSHLIPQLKKPIEGMLGTKNWLDLLDLKDVAKKQSTQETKSEACKLNTIEIVVDLHDENIVSWHSQCQKWLYNLSPKFSYSGFCFLHSYTFQRMNSIVSMVNLIFKHCGIAITRCKWQVFMMH